ncbi:MAG: hypothetical protein AAFX50_03855 [Acidobacteriota bacterium]
MGAALLRSAHGPSIDTGQRTVKPLELLKTDGWRVKLYAMGLDAHTLPDAELVDAARAVIVRSLPTPAIADGRYGVAFATVHAGEHGDYVVLDWWTGRDILKHHLFGAPRPHGGELRYGWPNNACCCVWELAVLWFERNAWFRHVLDGGRGHLDGYLAERMEGTV